MKTKSLKVNALLNIIKQVSGILFPLLVFPYVSRTLGASNYGKYSFSLSIVSYFLMFSRLGISTFAIREGSRIRNNKEEIEKLVNELYSLNIILTFLSYLFFFLALTFVNQLQEYKYVLLIQSLAIILTTVGSDWINQIYEDYAYITVRYIILQILAIIPIFLWIKEPSDYYIYTLIAVLASYGGNLFNIFYIKKYINRRFTLKLNLKKNLKPILILFSGILAIEIYVNSDIVMIGFFEEDSQVGIYSGVSKIYNVAKQVVNAITVVTIPRIAASLASDNKNTYYKLTQDIFLVLLSLSIPCSIGLILLSKDIIMIINGVEYLEGNLAFKILCASFSFSILSSFFVNGILVPNRKEIKSVYSTSVAGIGNIILNLILIPQWGIVGASVTTLLAEFYVLISSIVYAKSDFRIKINKKDIFLILISSVVVALICGICKMIENLYLRVVMSIGLSIPIYLGILFFCKFSPFILYQDKVLSYLKLKR